MRIISGKYRGKKLASPTSKTTRPTSDRARETIFNILEHNPGFAPFSWKKKRVVDVFAGTGALGLEALSRGAEHCVFVESAREALSVLKTNCVGMEDATKILSLDACAMPQATQSVQVVFLDPPYNTGLVEPTLVRLVEKGWIAKGSIIIVETEKCEAFRTPDSLELVLEKKVGVALVQFYRALM